MAVIFNNLMNKIGFKKYYIQGGDWGSIITENMAILFPENVTGVLSNMPLARTPMATIKAILLNYFPSLILTEDEYKNKDKFNLKKKVTFWEGESGYGHIQSTKPDTIGTFVKF